MIGSSYRSLFRVDCALKFGIFYVKSLNYFQRVQALSLYKKRITGVAKDSSGSNTKDPNKKLKAVGISQWRPVSIQAASSSSSSAVQVDSFCMLICIPLLKNDLANELKDGVQIQDTMKVAQVVTEITDSTVSSDVLDDNVNDNAVRGESLISAERHSLSLEVAHLLFDSSKGKKDLLRKRLKRRWELSLLFRCQRRKNLLSLKEFQSIV